MTQGAVPPAEGARGLPHGQRRAARLDDRRRPVVRVRRRAHGRGHRALHRRARRHHPRDAGRARGQEPRARRRGDEGRPVRRGDRAGRDPAAQGRPDRSSTPTRACAPAPPPSRSAACGPRSPRTAPSPPATRRRSPTARAAVVVTSRAKAEELGLTPIAELVSFGMVAGPDTSLLTQPSRAIKRALEPDRRQGLRPRPLRAQRGVRRRRARVDAATSASPTTS